VYNRIKKLKNGGPLPPCEQLILKLSGFYITFYMTLFYVQETPKLALSEPESRHHQLKICKNTEEI
jgi:hypothetical protein